MIGEAEEEGDWNQCFFGSIRAQDVEEGCRRFWANTQAERVVRDDKGKIIDVLRTDLERVRPDSFYVSFENHNKKNT